MKHLLILVLILFLLSFVFNIILIANRSEVVRSETVSTEPNIAEIEASQKKIALEATAAQHRQTTIILGFIRGIAADERAEKTVKEIDRALATRESRFDKMFKRAIRETSGTDINRAKEAERLRKRSELLKAEFKRSQRNARDVTPPNKPSQ